MIIGILAIVTVASLIKTRKDPTAKAHPGSLRATRKDPARRDEQQPDGAQ